MVSTWELRHGDYKPPTPEEKAAFEAELERQHRQKEADKEASKTAYEKKMADADASFKARAREAQAKKEAEANAQAAAAAKAQEDLIKHNLEVSKKQREAAIAAEKALSEEERAERDARQKADYIERQAMIKKTHADQIKAREEAEIKRKQDQDAARAARHAAEDAEYQAAVQFTKTTGLPPTAENMRNVKQGVQRTLGIGEASSQKLYAVSEMSASFEQNRMYSYGVIAAGAALGSGFALYRSQSPSVYAIGSLGLASAITAWGLFRLAMAKKDGKKDLVEYTLKAMAYDILKPLFGEEINEAVELFPAATVFGIMSGVLAVAINVVLGGFDEVIKTPVIFGASAVGGFLVYELVACIRDRDEDQGILFCAFDKARTDVTNTSIALLPSWMFPGEFSNATQSLLVLAGITAYKFWTGAPIFTIGSMLGSALAAFLAPLAVSVFGAFMEHGAEGATAEIGTFFRGWFDWIGSGLTEWVIGLASQILGKPIEGAGKLVKGFVDGSTCEMREGLNSIPGMSQVQTAVDNAAYSDPTYQTDFCLYISGKLSVAYMQENHPRFFHPVEKSEHEINGIVRIDRTDTVTGVTTTDFKRKTQLEYEKGFWKNGGCYKRGSDGRSHPELGPEGTPNYYCPKYGWIYTKTGANGKYIAQIKM